MSSYAAVLTIPSGKVASNLTAFVVRVDLSTMPADWWAACDGENLRVKASGTDVPIDLVSIDTAAKTGELFFKASLLAASNNVFTVECVDGATAPADTDTNGRNNVWVDYDFVCVFAEMVDRTGNGHDPTLSGTSTGYSSSTEINPGSSKFDQGAAWDGTYWYSVGGASNRRVEKFSTAGVSQTSVADLSVATAAFNGLTFTHGSGCTVMGGELYISVEDGDSSGTNQHVVVLNVSDLSVNRIYDVSGHGEMSDICWNSDDSLFVLSDFNVPTRLHTFSSTFTGYAALTLPGSGVSDMQGIEWSNGLYLIMSGPILAGSNLYTVADDMSGSLTKAWSGPSHLQGLALKVHNTSTPDVYVGAGNSLLKLTFNTGTAVPGWLSLNGNGHAEVQSLHKRTGWTYGATATFPAVPTANRTVITYSDYSSNNNNRETISIQANSKWDLWDTSNVHIASAAAATSGDIGVRHRIAAIFNGTTVRTMYRQGAQIATDATVTQRPAGGTDGTMALFIGGARADGAERWIGAINYVYLRNSVLSADWLAAEYASWEGSTFYTVAPAITVDGLVPPVTGSATLVLGSNMTVDGIVSPVTGSVSITSPGLELTIDGVVPPVTGDVSLDIPGVVVAGVVGPVTGDVTLSAAPLSAWAEAVTDLGSDVIFWARLADGLSSTLTDVAGGHDGTYHGLRHTALPVVGEGASVSFDITSGGGSGYADVPVAGWLDAAHGPTEFSLFMWANRVGSGGSLFGESGISQPVAGAIGADLVFDLQAGGGPVRLENDLFVDGRYFVGITFAPGTVAPDLTPGATGYRLYQNALTVDGVNVEVDWVPGWNDNTLRLGSAAIPLGAAMDEVILVNRALTPTEISALYTAGLASDLTIDGTVGPITGSVTISLPPNSDMTVDGLVAPVTGDVTVELSPVVTVDGLVPPVTGDVTVELVPISFLTIDGIVGPVTGDVDLRPPTFVTIDGLVSPVTGDVDIHGADTMSIDGLVGPVTGDVTFGIPPQTDTGNRASGRTRSGIGYVFYEPPVVQPPDFSIAQHAFVTARAYTSVDVSTGRAVVTAPIKANTRRARDRVIVGGKDVTFFRGVATPAPSYTLVVPLLYGPATLDLPQVAAAFETPGHGPLSWARKGAKVLVQRVNPDTNEVIATDYKGIVIAHDISGRNLQLQIGGEATGRAALIDKQPPLFFKRNDLGFWWWGAVQDLGLRFEPRLGIDTGIRLRNAGGMSQLDYMNDLSVKGARRNGTQLTCMPDRHEDGGAYRVVEKDPTTIRATVYFDDAVTVPDVRDDLAEQPNRVFATGVTPEGMRVKFGAYPILRNATPPPYPFSDDREFGVGTSDDDTDTGDGVSVMIWRLVKAGYLALIDKPGGYDDDVADAIQDLKTDALSGTIFVNGDMTPAAWAALFDASATGFNLAGTQILPAAQRSKTRKWNRSANGSVIGRNDGYDPTVLPVDTTIDAGVGMTRKQIRGFARGELTPTGEGNYAGTITLNSGAVIDGTHTPGDPVNEELVLDGRALRPGENLWAPLFGPGGTVFPITGIDKRTDDQGITTITLDVDTQARDTMKVWEVIRRNRDSRRNPARAWLNQHRSSALTKDAVVEYDEIGGVLDDRVDLAGGAWTVFTDVAAQAGTIQKIRIEARPATEYVMAVFCREITAAHLTAMIGNPLTKGGKKRWVNPAIRAKLDKDHVLVYAVGEKQAPLGYFPGKKFSDPLPVDDSDDDATDEKDAAFVTGDWQDDAGFGYETFNAQMIWIAIWAADATHLTPGRIMWPQIEAGS